MRSGVAPLKLFSGSACDRRFVLGNYILEKEKKVGTSFLRQDVTCQKTEPNKKLRMKGKVAAPLLREAEELILVKISGGEV